MRTIHIWTSEDVEKLSSLWTNGATSYEIATALGMTRNQISGKLSRLGLFGKGRKEPRERPSVRRQKPQTATVPEPSVMVPNRDLICVAVEPIRIGELSETRCKWPVGDPADFETFRYCGARKEWGSHPYCNEHAALAYLAPGKYLALKKAAQAKGENW